MSFQFINIQAYGSVSARLTDDKIPIMNWMICDPMKFDIQPEKTCKSSHHIANIFYTSISTSNKPKESNNTNISGLLTYENKLMGVKLKYP